MNIYIYIYIYIYVCMYVCIYTYTHTYIHTYINTFAHAHVCVCEPACVYFYTYVHTCKHACMHIHILTAVDITVHTSDKVRAFHEIALSDVCTVMSSAESMCISMHICMCKSKFLSFLVSLCS